MNILTNRAAVSDCHVPNTEIFASRTYLYLHRSSLYRFLWLKMHFVEAEFSEMLQEQNIVHVCNLTNLIPLVVSSL